MVIGTVCGLPVFSLDNYRYKVGSTGVVFTAVSDMYAREFATRYI